MKVELVRATVNPIEAMSLAGSNCYDIKPSAGLVNHCYKSDHTSIMEFGVFHFHIEGISRVTMAQLTRHRIASFAIRSQRYCDENNFEFSVPPSINHKLKNKYGYSAKAFYDDFMEMARATYKNLVEMGVPKEDARFILPNGATTKIDVQFNFRSLMNFMNLRLCTRSQWEIRNLAIYMKDLIIKRYPELEKYLAPKCEKHNPYFFCTEKKCCGKYPHISEVFNITNN